MKNESLTPNPSPKGEGSKMKNLEWKPWFIWLKTNHHLIRSICFIQHDSAMLIIKNLCPSVSSVVGKDFCEFMESGMVASLSWHRRNRSEKWSQSVVTIQRIIILSRLRREIFQIFTNKTNFYVEKYKDLADLNWFVGFLPDRALLDIIRWMVTKSSRRTFSSA